MNCVFKPPEFIPICIGMGFMGEFMYSFLYALVMPSVLRKTFVKESFNIDKTYIIHIYIGMFYLYFMYVLPMFYVCFISFQRHNQGIPNISAVFPGKILKPLCQKGGKTCTFVRMIQMVYSIESYLLLIKSTMKPQHGRHRK